MNVIVKTLKTFSRSHTEVKNLIHNHNNDNDNNNIEAIFVTIPFSHFCEKARWILDLSPLSNKYLEDAHAAGLHQLVTKSITKGKNSSVPLMVILDDKEKSTTSSSSITSRKDKEEEIILTDSTDIIVYLIDKYPKELSYLLPEEKREEILKFVLKLDQKLGPNARQFAYSYLLPSKEGYNTIQNAMARYSPLIEKLMVPMFMPVFKSIMLKQYDNASDESKAKAWKECQDIFEEVSMLLEQQNAKNKDLGTSTKYIFGGQKPTLADITFASLAYPLVCPQKFDSLMAPLSSFPSSLLPLIEEMRSTTAGKHALIMYKNHRFPKEVTTLNSQIIPKIMGKTISRNKNFGLFATSFCALTVAILVGRSVTMPSKL